MISLLVKSLLMSFSETTPMRRIYADGGNERIHSIKDSRNPPPLESTS